MITELHRWSTAQAPQGMAYSAWGRVAEEYFRDYRYHTADPENFRGAFVQRGIGPLDFTAFYLSRSKMTYRPDRASGQGSRFELKYICRGSARLSSERDEEALEEGSMVLLDHARGFTFASDDGVECASMRFPEHWLETVIADVETSCFHVVEPTMAWAKTLGSTVREVADLPAGDHAISDALIADHLRGLLELVYGNAAPDGTTYRRQLVRAIIREISARHQDADLRVDDIARKFRISKRHLHGVLAAAGTTFGQELTRIRLSRARAMLENPSFHGMTIGEIAFRCGFNDAAHFTRRFGEAYGRPPSVVRAELWNGRA